MWNTTRTLRWSGRLLGSAVLALAILLPAGRPAAAAAQLPSCQGGWVGGIIDSGPWLRGVAALGTNDIWAVGDGQIVEHWNGSTWQTQEMYNGLEGDLMGIAALAPDDIWAVGHYSLVSGLDWGDSYHWNGTTWSHFDSHGAFGPLNAVAAVAANDVWAVGRGGAAGGVQIMHWNGNAWTFASEPYPGGGELFGVRAVSAADVWAVGYDWGADGHRHTLTEHWNGTQWSIVPAPDPGTGAQLNAITGVDGNHVWAVGEYTTANNTVETLTLFWNGNAWSRVANPSPGRNAYLYGVTALARHDVWAVGSTEDWLSGQVQTLILHWDGTSWTVSNSRGPGQTVNSLYGVAALTATDVWAVGRADQPYGGLVEHYYFPCP